MRTGEVVIIKVTDVAGITIIAADTVFRTLRVMATLTVFIA